MRTIIIFIFIVKVSFLWSQEANFFHQKREYHYNAVYIDAHGDTISSEKLIIKPLCKPWFVQPNLQMAFQYIYSNDSNAFRRYIDPKEYVHQRDLKFDKKGKMRIRPEETTGGYSSDNFFYMHPPRCNQFRMLFLLLIFALKLTI